MAAAEPVVHFNDPDKVSRGCCCHVDCTKKLTAHDKQTLKGAILFERRYNSVDACMTHYKLHRDLTKVRTDLSWKPGETLPTMRFRACCVGCIVFNNICLRRTTRMQT